MRRGALGIALIAGLSGCGAGAARAVNLELSPEVQALVAAVVRPEQGETLTLHEPVPDDWTLELSAESEAEPLGIELAVYTRSLTELGVEPGPLELVPSGEGFPLPAAATVHRARFGPGVPGTWEIVDPVAPFGGRELSTRGRCFDEAHVRSIEVEVELDTVALLAEPPRGAWVVGEHGVLLSLDIDSGTTTPIETSGFPSAPDLNAAWRAADGELWFGGKGLWHGRPEAGRLEVRTATVPPALGQVMKMGGGVDAEGRIEVWAITHVGALLRHLDGAVEVMGRFPNPEDFEGASRFGLVRLGPGWVAATAGVTGGVLWHHPERGSYVQTIADSGFTALGDLGPLGLLATGRGGLAYRLPRDETDWVRVPDNPLLLVTRSSGPFLDGFLIGGGDGTMVQYRKGFGFCPRVLKPRRTAVEHIAPLDDGTVLFTGDNYDEARNSIEVLAPY